MWIMKTSVLIGYFLFNLVVAEDLSDARKKLKELELSISVGGNITLDYNELHVNNIIKNWKNHEFDNAFKNQEQFHYSSSYFEYRKFIKTSKLYHFIKAMPKGALLHVHGNAILKQDYFINATYREGLYICLQNETSFKFSKLEPTEKCDTKWRLMKDVRKAAKNVEEFDQELSKNFTLIGFRDYNCYEKIWERFLDIFRVIYPLWAYRPVWEDYLYKALTEIRNDNIMYVEIRTSIPKLYELNGTEYDETFFVNTTKKVVDKFISEYPDFYGAKIICAFNRNGFRTPGSLEETLNLTKTLRRKFPDFVAGFDLVSNEDSGVPLQQLLPQLQAAGNEVKYFFHAGETNWYGAGSDENLLDAVLLGSKRIGHAVALAKHPGVAKLVTSRGIGIEAAVVSNNVLGLVRDARMHPLASWLANGMPVVLAGDDPGFWDAQPLSTDFYVTFVGVSSHRHDLRMLKQLALNSLHYSALSPSDKETALKMFTDQWNVFMKTVISNSVDRFEIAAEEERKKLRSQRKEVKEVRPNSSPNFTSNRNLILVIVIISISIIS